MKTSKKFILGISIALLLVPLAFIGYGAYQGTKVVPDVKPTAVKIPPPAKTTPSTTTHPATAPSKPTPVAVKQAKSPIVTYTPPTIAVADVYTGVNNERIAHGLGTLAVSQVLEASACAKANDMITKNYWAHISPDGITPWYWFDTVGYYYSRAGENLGYGHTTAQRLMYAWIESPTHEANIVGNFTEMGVCSVRANFQGSLTNVVVNHFATPQ